MSINKVLFSRASDEWETPQTLFDQLHGHYQFDLDPCATAENAKCERFFTKADNGLDHRWSSRAFVNPPYSDIASWAQKCVAEAMHGCLVVLLVPARTDTKWFHQVAPEADALYFLRGRLRFKGGHHTAPFPSVIMTFADAHPIETLTAFWT